MPAVWAILCIAFYWDVLKAPAWTIVGGNDLNHMFRIWLEFARSSLSAGRLPLWNPYLFSGYAFIADPQPALFYPPTWLSFILPAAKGLNLSLVFHIWWSAVGCTLWLRAIHDTDKIPLSWASAMAGAAVYAFSGYTFARIQAGHMGVITTGAWLPWILFSLQKLTRKHTWGGVACGSLCIGLSILAGHTATFIYIALIAFAYTVFLTWQYPTEKRFTYLWMAFVMGCLGLLLAGVQLLPTLHLLSSSTRLDTADYTFASRFSWPAGYLITLLIPNFFGEPVRTGYWGDGVYEEMIFYVGLIPLFMAWFAYRNRRNTCLRTYTSFWLGAGIVSLLTALGSNSIVHRLFYRFIPLFSSMRAPARAGLLFTISAAFMTALGIHTLTTMQSEQREYLIAEIKPKFITMTLVISGLLTLFAFGIYAWGRDSQPQAGRFWHMANAISLFAIFFLAAAAWFRAWIGATQLRRLAAAAIILILLDLWTLGNSLVQLVPITASNYWERVAQHIGSDAGRVLPWGLSIFEQNGAITHNVKSVFGYNPVEDATYNQFITYNPDPRAVVYDLLNVTHVATTVPSTLGEEDSLKLITEDQGVYVYKRLTACPDVWMPREWKTADGDEIVKLINDPAFNPLQTVIGDKEVYCPYANTDGVHLAEIVSPEKISASVQGEGGIVVFSQRYGPDWQATIDEETTTIYKAYGILQAVCVPPGKHIVTLKYQLRTLQWGAVTSLSALVLCGFLTMLKTSNSGKQE
ncbi:MAG: hypothetical protein P1S60_03905 [Anaerolineae bacterium]|nr:hypothetical protein [Anaerolineae bacterium]